MSDDPHAPDEGAFVSDRPSRTPEPRRDRFVLALLMLAASVAAHLLSKL